MLTQRCIALIVVSLLAACDSAGTKILSVFIEVPFWPQKVDSIYVYSKFNNISGNRFSVLRGARGFAFAIPEDWSGELDVSAAGYTETGCRVSSGHLNRSIAADAVFPIVDKLSLSPTYTFKPKPPSAKTKINCNAWFALSGQQKDFEISQIWGIDDTHIWIAGNNGASYGVMQYWDGKSISELFRLPSSVKISSVLGASLNQILIGTNRGIQKWDGLRLTPVASPAETITAMWGKDENDMWVSTYSDVYQWDGAVWMKHNISQISPGFSIGPWKLHGYDNHNVWFVRDGHIYYWDGTSWQYQCLSPNPRVSGIWGTNIRSAWIGSYSGVFQWDGVSWGKKVEVNGFFPNAMIGFGDDSLIVIGDDSSERGGGKTVTWDGTAWNDNFVNAQYGLMAIWAKDPDHIYAVDQIGQLLRCVNWNR